MVPTRTNVSTPTAASSSTAMAADGEPMPVEQTVSGRPSYAIAVEELAAVGVETFVRVGTTGALQPGVEIGDTIVATGAAKDEGTTKRYEDVAVPAVPDYGTLSALVEASEARNAPVHVGPVATDDAFYAETDDYVEAWNEAGLLAVEMEAVEMAAASISTQSRPASFQAATCSSVSA